jgi:hypothetical protein
MNGAFIYNKYVTGKHHIGRKSEGMILSNLLSQGENVLIYEPPKTGKTSLIQQTFYNMRIAGEQFEVAESSLLGIRDRETFMLKFGNTVLRLFCTTPDEYASAVSTYLEGSSFVFDEEVFANEDKVITLKEDANEADFKAIITLPLRIAEATGKRCFILIKEFQDFLLFSDDGKTCILLSSILKEFTPEQKKLCTFIFTGSQVNAMKEIFEQRGLFHRTVEHVPINPIDAKDIIDYVVKGFLVSGKVIERDLLLGVCKLFRQNIWYINHFASICDSLSKGYIMEPVLLEALDMMISIHEPRFIATMDSLTTFQLSLLKAILEGHQKFSSSEVISKYGLNSSANVLRLKNALCKKEIITFDSMDMPIVLDPLFEYWAKKYYFEING